MPDSKADQTNPYQHVRMCQEHCMFAELEMQNCFRDFGRCSFAPAQHLVLVALLVHVLVASPILLARNALKALHPCSGFHVGQVL